MPSLCKQNWTKKIGNIGRKDREKEYYTWRRYLTFLAFRIKALGKLSISTSGLWKNWRRKKRKRYYGSIVKASLAKDEYDDVRGKVEVRKGKSRISIRIHVASKRITWRKYLAVQSMPYIFSLAWTLQNILAK